MWAVGPFICMRPKAEMKLETALYSFLADELQHLEIFIALGIRQRNRADIIPWHCEQKRIGEMKIGIRDVGREIIADSKSEAEAVETLSRKFSQVCLPE